MREMKDSGIEWIGKIPDNWTIKKLKYSANNREYKVPDNTGNGYFALENVIGWKGTLIDTESKYDTTGAIYCKKYDIAFGKLRPYLAKVFQVDYDRCCSSEFAVFYGFDGISRYYFYIMLSNGFVKAVDISTYGVKMPRANIEFIKNIYIPIPPLSEQQAISAYLDKKCSEIDSLVSDIQSQIEALEEYKRSVITEAVTKGLNPDAEMKDSGIEWVGKIPKHWRTNKGKYIFRQRSEKGNLIELQLLSPTQKYGVIPQSLYEELTTNTAVKVNEKTNLMTFKTIHIGDYCISLRSFQGGFEYSLYEGVVSPAYTVFYAIQAICEKYYKYLFKDQCFIKEINSFTLSLRDGKNISFEDFGNTYLPFPPLEEQQQIADYLDQKCTQIDSIIAEKKQQIETIEEYKKSLIFEYVTGKKEVTQ